MNKIRIILLSVCVLTLTLFMAGCSYVIEITYDNNDPYAPTFSFKEKHILFDWKPSVREISFYKIIEGKVDYANPLWSIEADGIKIDKISYGILPKGFRIVSPAKKLTPSTKYHLFVSAWGSGGYIEFQTPGDI
ncbi:MAG: hypothetical protein Q7T83_05270 [Thermodesulfovibrionales bacterium]|nr:hypothetical protein [Thermodesulfovibrionales bacterium]MDP3112061.1 hypothetical protein [Thermodesulfovibrionales bacterium]